VVSSATDGASAAKSHAGGPDGGVLRARSESHPIDRLLRYLDRLATSGFYGKVTVSFQNGKVHDVRIEQTKKLDEL